jgi:hypothetical protein
MAISSIAGTSRPIVRKSGHSKALPLSLGGSGKACMVASTANGIASSIKCRLRQWYWASISTGNRRASGVPSWVSPMPTTKAIGRSFGGNT